MGRDLYCIVTDGRGLVMDCGNGRRLADQWNQSISGIAQIRFLRRPLSKCIIEHHLLVSIMFMW